MHRSLVFAIVLSGFALAGCQSDRRQITPTTLGTDLKRMPRGTMKPYAWPGQDLVKTAPAAPPTADSNALRVSNDSTVR